MSHSTATANSGSDCEVAIAAKTGATVYVSEVHFSYADTPTDGLLLIVERNEADDADATILYRQAVTSGGIGPVLLGG
jgi:hypothetical protein